MSCDCGYYSSGAISRDDFVRRTGEQLALSTSFALQHMQHDNAPSTAFPSA